jgi:hypothetical protein
MGESFFNLLRLARRLLPLIAVCCALNGTTAFAACNAVPSSTEVAKLNWPTLQIPSGSNTYKIDGAGGGDSGTGTKLYGTSARGQYTISKASGGEPACSTITIDVKNVNCQASGCSLGAFTGNYNGANLSGSPPWTGLAKPASGKTLYLGATATYDGTVTAGARTPTFDLAIHYDANTDTTLSQTASLGFDLALTVDTVVDINFGVVKALTSGDYTINTSGAVTAANGGVFISGTPVAGGMKIHGSSAQTINISVGSYAAGGIGGGVTLSNATCSYNGGAAAACSLSSQAAPTSAGKTLLLGVKATVNASQTAGSAAAPSFTVTVIYT